MNDQQSPCPRCGAKMDAGSPEQMCPKCTEGQPVNNALPPIFSDKKYYTLYIIEFDKNNREHLRVISSIANINYLGVKELAGKLPVSILRDQAPKMVGLYQSLYNSGINFSIEPHFPWKIDDMGGIILSR